MLFRYISHNSSKILLQIKIFWIIIASTHQFREECGYTRICGVSVHTYEYPGGTRAGWCMPGNVQVPQLYMYADIVHR